MSKNKFKKNTKKDRFLSGLQTISLESKTDSLTKRCKFNFHYMDFSQEAGQKFEDWGKKQLVELLKKLKAYCGEPLKY